MSFIPSMTTVGSMCGGRSPISVGVIVSPKAALTVHLAGLKFLSLLLSPVPDVEAPLSIMTLSVLVARDMTLCVGPSACRRFKVSVEDFRSFLRDDLGTGVTKSTTSGVLERGLVTLGGVNIPRA